MDVGTLTGSIELNDQISSAMSIISGRIKGFVKSFENAFGVIAIGALGAVTAITSIGATIMALASSGSTINDVEAAFDRLAKQAGSTGDILISRLSKGVRGTVDSMQLMQTTTRALQAGVKLTADDMEVLGATARAIGKATGTDASQGLETLSRALTTGQTRALKMAGITIDLEKAQKNLAKELKVEVSQLSDSGRLYAARAAMMEAFRLKVVQLGESQLSFKEKMMAASVAIGNWFDDLKKGIDKSPAVAKAFDDISNALVRAFGSSSQTLLQNILSWIDSFARAVSSYGPPIIDYVAKIWRGIVDIWNAVQEAWNLVPDWFKNIAKEAALAGGAVYVTHKALGALSGGGSSWGIADIATTISGLKDSITLVAEVGPKATAAMKNFVAAVALTYTLGGVSGIIASIGGAIAAIAATPAGIAVLVAALAAALWEVGKAIKNLYEAWQSGKSMWDFLTARDEDNFLRRWLGLSTGVDAATAALKRFAPVASHAQGLAAIIGPVASHKPTTPKKEDLESLVNARELEEQRRKILQEGLARELSLRTYYAGMRNRQQDSEHEIELNNYLAHLELMRNRYAGFIAHQFTSTNAANAAKNRASDAAKVEELNNIARHYEQVERYSSVSLRNEAITARRVYEEMASRAGEFSAETIQHFKAVAEEAENAANGMKGSLGTSLKTLGEAFSELAQISGGAFGGIVRDIGEFIGVLSVAEQAGKAMDGGLKRMSRSIETFGNKGITTAKSVGEFAAGLADLASGAMAAYGALQKATDSMSRAKNVMSGAAAGAKAGGQIAGGYGAIVGAMVGAVWGWVKSNTIESRLVSPLRDAFFEMEGGLERLNPLLMQIDGNMSKVQAVFDAKTPQAYEEAIKNLRGAIEGYMAKMKEAGDLTRTASTRMQEMVVLSPELEGALERVYNAGNADDYVAALKEMNLLMDEQAAEAQFLERTMEKYGLQWTDLGEKARAAHVATEAANIEKEFRALLGAGVEVNNIMRHMGDSISDFVLQAVKSGTEVPESFKDIIQTAIDAGEVFTIPTSELERLREEAEKLGKPFDDTKYKVDNLEEAGVTFGTTMEKATSNVALAIERLAKVLEERLGPAIRNVPDVDVNVNYHQGEIPKPGAYEPPSYAASGGYVTHGRIIPFKPRGTDTVPAMLTPGETVWPAGQAPGNGGGGTAIIEVDGETLAEIVVPKVAGVVRRYGLGRR